MWTLTLKSPTSIKDGRTDKRMHRQTYRCYDNAWLGTRTHWRKDWRSVKQTDEWRHYGLCGFTRFMYAINGWMTRTHDDDDNRHRASLRSFAILKQSKAIGWNSRNQTATKKGYVIALSGMTEKKTNDFLLKRKKNIWKTRDCYCSWKEGNVMAGCPSGMVRRECSIYYHV